jgi:hypothetical protein
MKYLTLLFLLPILLIASERKLESISYRSQAGTTIALIELDDGSIWKWTPDSFSENLLRRWETGDRILIEAINHQGFGLHNLDRPHYIPTVSLNFNSYLLYPTLRKADGAFGTLELSDGTKWEVLYDFNLRTLQHWTSGDRIIAVEGLQGNFELLNLDIPHGNRGQIERYMEVLPVDSALAQEAHEEEILSTNT